MVICWYRSCSEGKAIVRITGTGSDSTAQYLVSCPELSSGQFLVTRQYTTQTASDQQWTHISTEIETTCSIADHGSELETCLMFIEELSEGDMLQNHRTSRLGEFKRTFEFYMCMILDLFLHDIHYSDNAGKMF